MVLGIQIRVHKLIERTYEFMSYIRGVVMFQRKDPLEFLWNVGRKYGDWPHRGVDISLADGGWGPCIKDVKLI